MKTKLTFLLLALVATLSSCMCDRMISADAIADTLRPVLKRHDDMLTGALDPSTISAEDKLTFRRSSYLLLSTLEIALGNTPPPVPDGLVVNPTTPIPPGSEGATQDSPSPN